MANRRLIYSHTVKNPTRAHTHSVPTQHTVTAFGNTAVVVAAALLAAAVAAPCVLPFCTQKHRHVNNSRALSARPGACAPTHVRVSVPDEDDPTHTHTCAALRCAELR